MEQLLVATLGGDGWLENYGDGYLRPLKVASLPAEDRFVLPARDSSGWPITSESVTSWYWLEAQLDFDSPEAAAVATALLAQTQFNYPLVEMIAVDTEADTDEFGYARIVNAERYLIQNQADEAN
ncbi:hypothetical protein [Pseudomonas baetica]|uniref:hypothetical protein n=1 Tax=Pseudomonas baetica TaxID=674054 RepID=UPI002404AD65|nr:hypothetical protein [Pseudomonas baetica]MDF9779243.1 hypothetical protein [Pseudomonas baetica]